MMKKEPRNKVVSVSMTKSEYDRLYQKFQETTYRAFGHFLYALIMRKPLIKKYRNQSLEDVYECLVDIKNGLEKFFVVSGSGEGATPLTEKLVIVKEQLIKIYEECKQGQHQPEV